MMQPDSTAPAQAAEEPAAVLAGDSLETTLIPALLLGSRTLVEQRQLSAVGTLTLLEGDLIEIEAEGPERFRLGESVWLTVESPSGSYRMATRVIGRRAKSLALLFPYERYRIMDEKRIHPRVEVNCPGRLLLDDERLKREPTRADLLRYRWSDELRHEGLDEALLEKLVRLMDEEDLHLLEEEERCRREKAARAEIVVSNISLEGVGFRAAGGMELECHGTVGAVLDLGFELSCTLEILWRQDAAGVLSYGARMSGFTAEGARQLRAFVLHEQMKQYYQVRRGLAADDGAAAGLEAAPGEDAEH
ncbi:hypothetical protein NYE40_19010 [Paenibacillus sp. FSL W8-1187]|uniref:hypothetical protein n=1 Tax=Paenibacillus TaxID=44249 RepID=UPI00048C762B|nr:MULTISPECIES: hypothetical protein [Paenibacillus]QGG57647.1 hypothetical protein GE073_19965 [Paenibacillus sp. B01]